MQRKNLNFEVVVYSKPATQAKNEKKPVEYIGIVVPAINFVGGKISLQASFDELTKNPEEFDFKFEEISKKSELVADLARQAIDNKVRPVVHLIECDEPVVDILQKHKDDADLVKTLSIMIFGYTARSEKSVIQVSEQEFTNLPEHEEQPDFKAPASPKMFKQTGIKLVPEKKNPSCCRLG